MNKGVYKLSAFSLVLCVLLIGCSNKRSDSSSPQSQASAVYSTKAQYVSTSSEDKTYAYIGLPEKIIFYNLGKETVIEKNSDLYRDVLNLTAKRFSTRLDTLELFIDLKTLKDKEKTEYMLEFVYSSMETMQFPNSPIHDKEYTRLFMPLSGDYQNCVFFDHGDMDCSGPIGNLKSSYDLIEILK